MNMKDSCLHGWMVVPTVEFEKKRKRKNLERNMPSLALEILKLQCVLDTPVGHTQHRGQH